MIIKIGSCEFVITRVLNSERCVIVVREVGSNSEICVDMTKLQAATLADAIQAASK